MASSGAPLVSTAADSMPPPSTSSLALEALDPARQPHSEHVVAGASVNNNDTSVSLGTCAICLTPTCVVVDKSSSSSRFFQSTSHSRALDDDPGATTFSERGGKNGLLGDELPPPYPSWDTCYLDKCMHAFHITCIRQWIKVASSYRRSTPARASCPLCKQTFKRIFRVLPRIDNGDDDDDDDDEDEKARYWGNVRLFTEHVNASLANQPGQQPIQQPGLKKRRRVYENRDATTHQVVVDDAPCSPSGGVRFDEISKFVHRDLCALTDAHDDENTAFASHFIARAASMAATTAATAPPTSATRIRVESCALDTVRDAATAAASHFFPPDNETCLALAGELVKFLASGAESVAAYDALKRGLPPPRRRGVTSSH